MQDEYRKDFDPEKKPLEDSDIRYAWSEGSPVREKWTENEERKYEFSSMVMEQNLEHARHVENERMEFHTVFIAFYIGVLAWIFSDGSVRYDSWVTIFVEAGLIFFSLIAWTLNERWSNAFDRHMTYAKGCYYLLHKSVFGVDDSKRIDDDVIKELKRSHKDFKEYLEIEARPTDFDDESAEGGVLDVLPLYSFRINNPVDGELKALAEHKNVENLPELVRELREYNKGGKKLRRPYWKIAPIPRVRTGNLFYIIDFAMFFSLVALVLWQVSMKFLLFVNGRDAASALPSDGWIALAFTAILTGLVFVLMQVNDKKRYVADEDRLNKQKEEEK